ncbi:hypothetical protein BJ968_004746 [Kineococcus aurantiacus]|uniref:Uncharacterized protein n=1 Tax=Kineococcus aurantiacus TaxID=37633 RepID=A0A7Y9DQU2_9ACTN|nr:hypothetical protein [Kineococcus aurantiacus]
MLRDGLTFPGWLGVGAALVAIILVSAEHGRLPSVHQLVHDGATGRALVARASFGLFFVLVSRADASSGVAPSRSPACARSR